MAKPDIKKEFDSKEPMTFEEFYAFVDKLPETERVPFRIFLQAAVEQYRLSIEVHSNEERVDEFTQKFLPIRGALWAMGCHIDVTNDGVVEVSYTSGSLRAVERIIHEANIDCSFSPGGRIVVFKSAQFIPHLKTQLLE